MEDGLLDRKGDDAVLSERKNVMDSRNKGKTMRGGLRIVKLVEQVHEADTRLFIHTVFWPESPLFPGPETDRGNERLASYTDRAR